MIGSGGTLQGLHVINAAGDLVGYVYDFRPESVLAMLRQSLKKFIPVEAPPIDFSRKDAKFTLPEGGLVVEVTAKVRGGHDPVQKKEGTVEYDMQKAWKDSLGRERLWVRRDEAEALAGGDLVSSLKTRIVRYHLLDNTRGTPTAWTEGDIRKMDLSLAGGRLAGSVHLETKSGDRGFKAELLGFIESKEGKVIRFDLVARGLFWGEGRYTPGAPSGPFPFAVAFRLADPGDRLYRLVPDAVRCFPGYLE
jgi:hypothetical protein